MTVSPPESVSPKTGLAIGVALSLVFAAFALMLAYLPIHLCSGDVLPTGEHQSGKITAIYNYLQNSNVLSIGNVLPYLMFFAAFCLFPLAGYLVGSGSHAAPILLGWPVFIIIVIIWLSLRSAVTDCDIGLATSMITASRILAFGIAATLVFTGISLVLKRK